MAAPPPQPSPTRGEGAGAPPNGERSYSPSQCVKRETGLTTAAASAVVGRRSHDDIRHSCKLPRGGVGYGHRDAALQDVAAPSLEGFLHADVGRCAAAENRGAVPSFGNLERRNLDALEHHGFSKLRI